MFFSGIHSYFKLSCVSLLMYCCPTQRKLGRETGKQKKMFSFNNNAYFSYEFGAGGNHFGTLELFTVKYCEFFTRIMVI